MQITLTTSLVGHGFAHTAGDTIDRPETEAERLMAAGFAEPYVEGASPKTKRKTKGTQIEPTPETPPAK